MKSRVFTKVMATILSVIMVISLLPLSTFAYESNSNIEYIDGGSAEAGRYEQLGYGFNALSDTVINDDTLKNGGGVVINYDAVKASLLSTSRSEADVKYAKTAQELMLSFGIDYTNKNSIGLPLENAKFGFASKFGFSANLKSENIKESLYYYYREEILTGKYTLILPAQLLDNPSQIISEDFVYALEKLSRNSSEEKCADFFNTWGTHILVSYNKGAALEYVAVGHSTGAKFSANADIIDEMSSSAGLGDLTAETTQALAAKLGVAYNSSEYNLSHKWFGMGGSSNLIGANGADASTISADSIKDWKATVSQKGSVLIPQSTEWISIWELIPDTYAGAKKALQEYYMAHASGVNAAFFSKFTTYSEVNGATEIYYTSPTGYVSKIEYYADGSTKVAPNSKFNVVSLDADLSNIVFPKSSKYTVDEYGMVTMLATSGMVEVLVTDLEGNKIEGATKTFTVEKEGVGSLFAGGYGTAERPYLISNATEFANIRNAPSSYFVLTQDISLGNISPIDSFSGTFDGHGYTLSGWDYSPTTSGNAGLFREITSNGTVKNVTISNCKIVSVDGAYGTLNIGLVCGTNNGTISNVIVCGNSNIYGDMGSIDQNNNSDTFAGGICGTNCGTIEYCGVINSTINGYSGSGIDKGTANCWVGGIAGRTLSNSTISDCYSHGNTIKATAKGKVHKVWFSWVEACGWANIGGLVGRTDGTDIVITRSISYSNTISGTAEGADSRKNQGSLIGYVFSTPTMEYCYSESSDTLFGQGSVSGGYKISSLTAEGAIHNLTGFADHKWIQDSSGGHLSIAQNKELVISGGKVEYFVGEPLNLDGLSIEAVKNDVKEDRSLITGGFMVSGYDPNMIGVQTVTITYGKIIGTYNVTVAKPEISGIVISSTPYKTRYFKPFAKTNFEGEKLDFTGLSVVAQYNDGTTAVIPLDALTLPNAAIVTQTQKITVSYGGFTADYLIEAFDVLPSKLEVIEDSYKKNYALGDAFDPTGLQVKLTYNNGNFELLGADALTLDSTGFDANTADTYSIKVKYAGLVTSFDVIVGSVKSISIATNPHKLTYYSSEKKLITDGLSLNVTYDNGATKVVSTGFTVSGYDNTDIGKQDITVTYGGATTSFQITVIAVEMTSIEISEYPRTEYFVGNVFSSSGLTLKVNYNDQSYKEISSGFTVKLDGYDVDVYPTLITLGNKNVLVAYTENGVRKTVEYQITVVRDTITELQVVQNPNKTTYNLWDDFNYSGMIVYAVYASGKAEPVELTKSMFSVQKFTTTGTQAVTLNYEGRSVDIICTVNAPTSISVSKLPTKTEYKIGETISVDGIEITAHFADGSAKTVPVDLIAFTFPSTEVAGSKSVVVSYGSLVTTFEIMVIEETIDENTPQIVIKSKKATKGKEFTVKVEIRNNPGFSYLEVTPVISPELTLVKVQNGNLISDFTKGKQYVWVADEDVTDDGILMTFTFSVNDTAEIGTYQIAFNLRTCANYEEETVQLYITNGNIQVIDFIYGDANGDGVVDGFDVIRLKKYLANYDYDTNTSTVEIFAGADATGDGSIDGFDVIRLKKYLANYDYETGESTVVLGPQ